MQPDQLPQAGTTTWATITSGVTWNDRPGELVRTAPVPSAPVRDRAVAHEAHLDPPVGSDPPAGDGQGLAVRGADELAVARTRSTLLDREEVSEVGVDDDLDGTDSRSRRRSCG